MIQLIKMAFRDLQRNRRRTLFSMLALGMGLALLLLMASAVAGEIHGAFDSAIRLQSGHLQLRAKSYQEDKTSLAWADLIENPTVIASQVATLSQVKVATPRLFASGIVAAGDTSMGVRIVGIDPASEANAPFRDGLISGAYITADDRDGILIGKTLAEKMSLKAADQVNVLANTANGDVDQQVFTIRGIYTTHTPGLDQSTVFMPLAKAQAITQTENHASIIFVLLKDKDQADAVVTALKGNPYQVKTWVQLNDMLNQFEQLAGGYMYLLYLIVLGVTATVIINTLIMSVFERTREIGILSAIGMKGSRIMAMFFAESTLLGIGGIVIGLVLGALLVWYATVYGFPLPNLGVTGFLLGDAIHAYMNPSDVISLTIMTFIVTLLSAIYPAMLAANMEPVQALRGGK